jgi:hypothetical protein
VLGQDPFSGHVFCFRGRRRDLVKLLWWDGNGLCLFAKRLERGRFVSSGLCQRFCAHAADRRMDTIRSGEDWVLATVAQTPMRGLATHDDGASEGCLALATDVGAIACPTRIRGFPLPRPTSSLLRTVRCVSAQAPSGTPLADRPDQAKQLASDRGRGNNRAFAARGEAAVGLVQTQLRLPRKYLYLLWHKGQRSFIHCPIFGAVL